MEFINRFIIFLGVLILTVLILLFVIDLGKDELQVLMIGISIFSLLFSLFDFFIFRKK